MATISTPTPGSAQAEQTENPTSRAARFRAWWTAIPMPVGGLQPIMTPRACLLLLCGFLALAGALFAGGLSMPALAAAGLGTLVVLVNYPELSFLIFMLTVGLNWTIADWPTSPTKVGAGLAVATAVLALTVRGLRPRLHWMHMWLMAFACWTLLTANIAGNGEVSSGFSYTIIGWVLVLISTYQIFWGRRGMLRLFACYAIGCTAGCVMTIATFAQGGHATMVPVAGDVNDFGMLASSGVVVALGLAREKYRTAIRVFWLVCMLVCLTVAVGSFSRGTLMGLGVAAVVHFILQKKDRKALLVLFGALVVAALAVYPLVAKSVEVAVQQKSFVAEGNVSSRLDAWIIALNQFVQHPITGIGIGSLQDHYAQVLKMPPGALSLAYAHNTYVEILYGTGLVGAALMAVAIGWSLYTGWRTSRVERAENLKVAPWDRENRYSPNGVRLMVLPALVSVFVACLTVTEIMYPPFWMAFLLALTGSMVAGKPDGPSGRGRYSRRLRPGQEPGDLTRRRGRRQRPDWA